MSVQSRQMYDYIALFNKFSQRKIFMKEIVVERDSFKFAGIKTQRVV